MAELTPKDEQQSSYTGRPLQRVSWNEKVKDQKAWFKRNVDYYIGISAFQGENLNPNNRKNLRVLYNIYNNQFPLSWFNHITDPLNAKKEDHKKYPAKIRPTAMLRTNIDLLLGEYNKRPFAYQVQNLGEDAYNTYLDNLNKKIEANLTEHFIAVTQQELQAKGIPHQQIPQDEQIELPDSVKERFTVSYKDNEAIRGQKWSKRAIREYNVRQKMLKMYKDWLIAGHAYSYKNIENGSLIYERVSPLELDYGKSPNMDFVEDAEWQIRRTFMTVSDIVDKFYDDLKDSDHDNLERRNYWESPSAMYQFILNENYTNTSDGGRGLVPVYHVCWRGRKEIVHVMVTEEDGSVTEDILDGDISLPDNVKVIKREWVNEGYEGWRIGDDIYPLLRAFPVQRNEMNNFSKLKMPYNGRVYSNTHSENISVMELGVPFAVMFMITNFVLEKTLAKNKGKIALLDQNAIPNKDGWDDEKALYYADALGYMLLNRNQIGVDKSWNQYSVLDLSLFDQIKNLIELRDSFKRDWDDLLGITPPRKGQSAPNMDGLGVQQNSMFQSSVITDMINTLFEEFAEKEMQGLLDFSKFINVDGVRAIYNGDDYDTEVLNIDPIPYCSAELGVFFNFSANELQALNSYKANTQAMIQNGVKQSTILEVAMSNNVSELRSKLKYIEQQEMEQASAQAKTEHDREMEKERVQKEFAQFQNMLDIDKLNVEWDRRDQNELLKGEYAASAAGGDGDENNNGIPDATEITKRVLSAQQILSSERQKMMDISAKQQMQNKDLAFKKEELATKERMNKDNNRTALKNKVSGQK